MAKAHPWQNPKIICYACWITPRVLNILQTLPVITSSCMLCSAVSISRCKCLVSSSRTSLGHRLNRAAQLVMASPGSQQQQQRLLYTEHILNDSNEDTGVRILHLNKPETLNSLTNDMAAEFITEMSELQADTAMRALIVTGSGRAFSAGGDFQFIEDRMADTVDSNAQVLGSFYKTFLAIRQLPVVTIAAINGPAVGGGMGFAMACDMRIASSNAKLSYNFVKLGITPGMASTAVLPAATNHQVACRMLLTGDLITAAEAKQLGLVLDVVEPDQLLPAAKDLAGRIAAAAPKAVSATLQMLRLQLPWDRLEAAAELEAREQAAFFKGEDIKEGLAAVKQKRAPKFTSQAAIDPEIAKHS